MISLVRREILGAVVWIWNASWKPCTQQMLEPRDFGKLIGPETRRSIEIGELCSKWEQDLTRRCRQLDLPKVRLQESFLARSQGYGVLGRRETSEMVEVLKKDLWWPSAVGSYLTS